MAKIVDGHCSECRARLHLGAEIVEKGGVEYRGCWNCKAPIEETPAPVEEMKPRNFAWGEGPAEAPVPVPEPPAPEPEPAVAPQIAVPLTQKAPQTAHERWKAKQAADEAKSKAASEKMKERWVKRKADLAAKKAAEKK